MDLESQSREVEPYSRNSFRIHSSFLYCIDGISYLGESRNRAQLNIIKKVIKVTVDSIVGGISAGLLTMDLHV